MLSVRQIFSEYRLLNTLQECQADEERIVLDKRKMNGRSKLLSIEADQASTR